MSKTKTFIFSMIPLTFLLLILEIVGRLLYPFDVWQRAELVAARDPRVTLPYLSGDASTKAILKDIHGMIKNYVPFLGWIGGPDLKLETIHNNDMGLRDDPIDPRKANEIRILVLGGSSAWGLGASSNTHTIPHELQSLLNQDGKSVYRVMNGAFMGWTSREELTALLEFYDVFDPDIVVSYTGFNDITVLPNHRPGGLMLRPEAKVLAQAVEQQVKPMETSQAVRKVFGSLGIWRLYVYVKELKGLNAAPKADDYDLDAARQGIPTVARRYQVMADYLAHRGKRMLIALQPEIYTSHKGYRDEAEKQVKKRFLAQFNDAETVFAEMRKSLKDAYSHLTSNNVDVKDFVDAFDSTAEPVFIDACHVNDVGNRIIAKRLKEVILPLLQKPRPS